MWLRGLGFGAWKIRAQESFLDLAFKGIKGEGSEV